MSEAEASPTTECVACAYIDGGVFAGVRAELALMPDAVKMAPALAASALKLGERLDGDLNDLAPAPLHAELRNTLVAIRAHHKAKVSRSASDDLAAARARRRQDAAASG